MKNIKMNLSRFVFLFCLAGIAYLVAGVVSVILARLITLIWKLTVIEFNEISCKSMTAIIILGTYISIYEYQKKNKIIDFGRSLINIEVSKMTSFFEGNWKTWGVMNDIAVSFYSSIAIYKIWNDIISQKILFCSKIEFWKAIAFSLAFTGVYLLVRYLKDKIQIFCLRTEKKFLSQEYKKITAYYLRNLLENGDVFFIKYKEHKIEQTVIAIQREKKAEMLVVSGYQDFKIKNRKILFKRSICQYISEEKVEIDKCQREGGSEKVIVKFNELLPDPVEKFENDYEKQKK